MFLYEPAVVATRTQCTMEKPRNYRVQFRTFKYAKYATDVTFQQECRPGGSVQEGKLHFSGKHNICGFEGEVSVLPNGSAVRCTKRYPESVSGLIMF